MRLLSARVKFCQIPYANFETTSQFLSKFCIPLQFHERLYTPLYLFSSNNIYFDHKEPIKVKIFETLRAQIRICQIPYANSETTSRSSPNFVSLFSFVKDNSSLLFSSNNIYFPQKEHIKIKFFETFKCLGQNSSNSSCQF